MDERERPALAARPAAMLAKLPTELYEMAGHHAIDMLVTHLNAPYGAVVKRADIVRVLRYGDSALPRDDRATASVLGSLFDECSPQLVERACREAHVSSEQALAAYASLVKRGARRVPAWDALLGK